MTYDALNLLFQFLDSFAFIVLATVGLAVIFGMMGVINLAHGEFILVGAYGTTLAFGAGLPLPIAMAAGVLATAVFGLVLERTVIRRLYHRPLDSMVATWGLSLIVIQLSRIVFGNSLAQIGTPLGSVSYGDFSYSSYRLVLAGVAIAVLGGLYWLFMHTEFGVRARATMEDEPTARSMGIDTDRVYLGTFSLGSALAELTGALYAPTITMTPELGAAFLVEAFVTVVVGGSSVLVGTSLAGALLGLVNATFTNLAGTFIGQIAMLLAAILAIRLLPGGVTGLLESWRAERTEGSE